SEAAALQQSAGTVVALRDAELRAGAAPTASVVGRAAQGASFKVTGKAEGFYRVEAETGRPAFLAIADAKDGGGGGAAQAFQPNLQVSPPRLVIEGAPLLVSGPTFHLKVS